MSSQVDRPKHIRSLRVRNFKSIQDSGEVCFSALTVLAGANSSGKSSLMQPVLLLKQSLDEASRSAQLKLDGPEVFFDNPAEFLCRPLGASPARSMSLEFRFADGTGYEANYVHRKKHRIELTQSRYISPTGDITISEQMTSDELELVAQAVGPPSSVARNFKPVVARVNGQLVLGLARSEPSRVTPAISSYRERWIDFNAIEFLRDFSSSLTHLSGLRNNPARTYQATRTPNRGFGPHENRTASIVAEWFESEDPRLQLVQRHLAQLGLTWTVTAKRKTYSDIALVVGRTTKALHGGAKDVVNIADVGVGVSQALPVVVALDAASGDDIVYIEQPEIHLHPRAQVAMAGLIVETVMRGIQVVVETHSALMLLEFQRAVANRSLQDSDLSLVWFQRDEMGLTRPVRAHVDSAGAYGEWPEDFGSTLMETEKAYTQAAFEQLRLKLDKPE